MTAWVVSCVQTDAALTAAVTCARMQSSESRVSSPSSSGARLAVRYLARPGHDARAEMGELRLDVRKGPLNALTEQQEVLRPSAPEVRKQRVLQT